MSILCCDVDGVPSSKAHNNFPRNSQSILFVGDGPISGVLPYWWHLFLNNLLLYGFYVKSGDFWITLLLYGFYVISGDFCTCFQPHDFMLSPCSGISLLFQLNKMAANGNYIEAGSVIYLIVTEFEVKHLIKIYLCIVMTNKYKS